MAYDGAVEPICIDSELLGTRKCLVVGPGSFSWTAGVPKGAWHLDGTAKDDSDRCLDTAFRLGGLNPRLLPPEPFVRQMASLTNGPVPWQRVMPGWAHRAFVKRLVDEVVVASTAAPLDYYRSTWVPGNGIFRALRPAITDRATWELLVASGEGNVATTRSFEPGIGGVLPLVSYDRFRTLTGRLVVDSGPQILTLKKEHRRMLRSVHGDRGAVWALDFAALEARVLLYEHGRRCDDVDLYGMIARELGYDRADVKSAVITELYGGGQASLGARLGVSGKELRDFVRKVQVFFNTDDLLARVKAQFLATGRITNRYGRPVVVDEPLDHIFVAYYGQSTGVDVTMLGFSQVIDRLAASSPRTAPVFLLHDALFLDVHDDDLPAVREIKHVRVPGYVQRFPLRLEKVSG